MSITLQSEPRKITGRKVKKIRLEGLMPANIYGKDFKSTAIKLKVVDFLKAFKEAGSTSVVELVVGKESPLTAMIRNPQYHPVSDFILHADFYKVDLTKKVIAEVPVKIIGESLAVKEKGGILVEIISEIEVEALPTDIPGSFEVDVSGLAEINDAVLIKDLKYDKTKVAIQVGENETVVKVEPPAKEEEVAPPAEEVPAEEGEEKKEAEKKEGEPEEKKEGAEPADKKPKEKKEEKKPEAKDKRGKKKEKK